MMMSFIISCLESEDKNCRGTVSVIAFNPDVSIPAVNCSPERILDFAFCLGENILVLVLLVFLALNALQK